MEVKSSYRYARISAFKVREVTREIQGLPVTDALDILRFTPKKAATLVNKTLKSAVANAENNNDLRVENLTVREAVAGEGPTLKRFIPKARGSAGPIRKRMSHIYITLTDEIEIKRREEKSKAKKKPAAKVKSPSGATQAEKPAAEPLESTASETDATISEEISSTEAAVETPVAAESTASSDTPASESADTSKESTEIKS
jgi:large subunit ribosomal protein L22